ncbi:hypothetical protein CCZ01_07860 [Helicobacter monodelphidis]|uniref:winged helix-turn-helix domain-containing protein n=1 Tax=Helicobacter sp. 15-1451 TaxID=2004995 RepID=UPI000DCBC321|nr:winged helix-turn-helix domain-containing protein [Helicobacter sp. 15-1451]RAX56959.1 hypothetical protein CCZ01_07860 [Helicobacter sp. 15-1451]
MKTYVEICEQYGYKLAGFALYVQEVKQKEPKISNKEIAKRLGIDEANYYRLIKKLKELNIFYFFENKKHCKNASNHLAKMQVSNITPANTAKTPQTIVKYDDTEVKAKNRNNVLYNNNIFSKLNSELELTNNTQEYHELELNNINKEKVKKESLFDEIPSNNNFSPFELLYHFDFADKDMSNAWQEFCNHRKEIRKKLTKRGAFLILKRLKVWENEGFSPSETLRLSVMNGWQGVFKQTNTLKQNTAINSPKSHENQQTIARLINMSNLIEKTLFERFNYGYMDFEENRDCPYLINGEKIYCVDNFHYSSWKKPLLYLFFLESDKEIVKQFYQNQAKESFEVIDCKELRS